MEQSFADLLSDAFSETPAPSFLDGDLDFENLNFEEKLEEDKAGISHENLEDEALQQEAAVLSETKDTYMAENADGEQSDEEDFQGVGIKTREEEEEEDYTSSDGDSDQEGSATGDDDEEDMGTGEEPGELLRSVRCDDEFCNRDKEDRISAEEQTLAPEGAKNPQVRNEEQGESESDEEVSYFKRVPERGSEMMTKGDGSEEENEQDKEEEEKEQEDSSDSECEGMKIEKAENVLAQCFEQEVENPCRGSQTKASLEFPEISVQNLQDLIAEVDSEEYVEMKIKDFSGEEHQEAGESFADYPSDFSSCEYVEKRGECQESNQMLVTEQSLERAKDSDEEGDEYLYSIDLERDAHKFRSLDEQDGGKIEMVKHVFGSDDGGETGESDSYSSSDDEVHVRKSDEEDMSPQDLENKQLEETHCESIPDEYNRPDPATFNINWNLDVLTTDTFLSEDLLTTEDTDKAETPPSVVTPVGDINTYTAVQRGDAKTTSPSNQGSLDDSFFFNSDLEITEQGQLGDDEYEEERNWEQEQERIKAFYEFYDDSDGENRGEGRQTKVQFCADPLSQVIHYETDSSDRDSLSSSTDGEEDQSSAETSEELREPDIPTQMKLLCDPPNTQLPEEKLPEKLPDLSNTQKCTRKHKCVDMLKLTLKMGVVIVLGLLMFWVATDQAGWLSQMSFFEDKA